MSQESFERAIQLACQMRDRAHAKYSNFRVGAAVLTESGKIFGGCNIENVSYGLTMCAERVAIHNAVAAGETRLAALAVATPGGHAPCGACRQVAAEFCADLVILLVDVDRQGAISQVKLRDLLPARFELP